MEYLYAVVVSRKAHGREVRIHRALREAQQAKRCDCEIETVASA